MKPLKANWEITDSDEWCRIDYTVRSGHGYMILKEKLLFDNFKRFQRVLKGTDYRITEYYKVTMKDIIISALDDIKMKLFVYQCKLEREYHRIYPNDRYIEEYTSIIKWCENRIMRLEKKL